MTSHLLNEKDKPHLSTGLVAHHESAVATCDRRLNEKPVSHFVFQTHMKHCQHQRATQDQPRNRLRLASNGILALPMRMLLVLLCKKSMATVSSAAIAGRNSRV
jgi:hypothetical protein